MDNIKEMVASLAPKMNLTRVNANREFVVKEPLKKEMARECFIDHETLSRALKKINQQREDEEKASREKMFKRVKKVALWGGIILCAAIGVGVACSAPSGRNKKDEPKNQWEVEPCSLTTEEKQGPFDKKPDWIHIQEETDDCGNPDGQTIFYGYINHEDDAEKDIDWHSADGTYEATTSVPSEDSHEWEREIWEGSVARADEV